jgi:hypothetical protein
MLEQLLAGYRASVEVVKTRSAMNPILALCGICVIPFIVAAVCSTGFLQVFFAVMSTVPITVFTVAYFIWMFRDPRRLQSEDYQLQQEAMEAIKGRGDLPPSPLTTDHQQSQSLEDTSEPDLRIQHDQSPAIEERQHD